ncbi:hypothetical protein Bbelb_067120 [Branchiostoma belcheri]|nr:hypothetical protein Bbelb_067120 [Branchiostoma belcheri]
MELPDRRYRAVSPNGTVSGNEYLASVRDVPRIWGEPQPTGPRKEPNTLMFHEQSSGPSRCEWFKPYTPVLRSFDNLCPKYDKCVASMTGDIHTLSASLPVEGIVAQLPTPRPGPAAGSYCRSLYVLTRVYLLPYLRSGVPHGGFIDLVLLEPRAFGVRWSLRQAVGRTPSPIQNPGYGHSRGSEIGENWRETGDRFKARPPGYLSECIMGAQICPDAIN